MFNRISCSRLAINTAIMAIMLIVLTVNASIVIPGSLNRTKIDMGQQVAINVSWNGGSAPYNVTLYGKSCSKESVQVGPINSITTNSASTQFIESPNSSQKYYVEMDYPANSTNNSCKDIGRVKVNPDPMVTLSSDVGQKYVNFIANAIDGTPPYSFNWIIPQGFIAHEGSCKHASCELTMNALKSGTYTVVINATDSAGMHASASSNITVNALAVLIMPLNPAIDQGQTLELNTKVLNGDGNYTYQWYSGSSPDCASNAAITNATGSSLNISLLSSNASYCVSVGYNDGKGSGDDRDNKHGINATNASSITVNPLPSVTLGNVVSALDAGQNDMINAEVSGGSPPYTYNFSVYNSITDSLIANALYLNASTSNTFEWQPQLGDVGSVYANVIITDSAYVPVAANSVNQRTEISQSLSIASFTASANAVDQGTPISLTVNASGGTAPYTYNWLVLNPITNAVVDNYPITNDSATSSNFTYTPTSSDVANSPEQFGVVITDSASYPSNASSLSGNILINPPPSIEIMPFSSTISTGQVISFLGNVTGGTERYDNVSYSVSQNGNATSSAVALISGSNIVFKSPGTYSVTGRVTDSDMITAYSENAVVNVGTWNNMSRINILLPANSVSSFNYMQSNTTINVHTSNSITANVLIKNVTAKITSAPNASPVAGSVLSKLVVLNISVSSAATNSVGSINVTIGYPSDYTSPAPYIFNGTFWKEITPFNVNATSHTMTFSISPDPIVGVFGSVQNQQQQSSGIQILGSGGTGVAPGSYNPMVTVVLATQVSNIMSATNSTTDNKSQNTTMHNYTSTAPNNAVAAQDQTTNRSVSNNTSMGKGGSNLTSPTYNSTASPGQALATGSSPSTTLEIEVAAVLIVLAATGYRYASKSKKGS